MLGFLGHLRAILNVNVATQQSPVCRVDVMCYTKVATVWYTEKAPNA